MVPARLHCSTEQASSSHARKVETVLRKLYVSPEPLLLDELEPCVCSVLLDLLDRVYHVLMRFLIYITRHIFWYAPPSIVRNIQVITQGRPVALLALQIPMRCPLIPTLPKC
jgi:hypothetical protein